MQITLRYVRQRSGPSLLTLQIRSHGRLCFARLLPPLSCMPAIQYVAAYCSEGEVLGVVDLRPIEAGVHVIQVQEGATPAARIGLAVQQYGEPRVERPLSARLAQGQIQVLHREHVVDPYLPLSAAQPAPIVVLTRRSHLAAGFCDPNLPVAPDEDQFSAADTLDFSPAEPSGTVRLHAVAACSWMCGLLSVLQPRAVVLFLPLLFVAAVQEPVGSGSLPAASADRSWQVVKHHPGLASVEEHSTIGRSWPMLDARETLGIAFDGQTGLPEFRFCLWSPADWGCFFLPGSSAPAVLRERLFEAKVALGRSDCVLWDPLPHDRAIHLVATSPDQALVTVVADTGKEYLCLDVSRQRFGASLLSALQALCPDRCFRISEAVRTPVRHGDVIRVFDDRPANCRPPQFFVPRFTLSPMLDVGTQVVYITSVDMGTIRLRVPAGVETSELERALVVWLGRQRCLGSRLVKLDLDVSVPVYCLPRRGRSTLVVGLIDLADTIMDTVVHVVDSAGLEELVCEVLREPWRPHSAFWNDILERGPVCVSCWQVSAGSSSGGVPVSMVTLGHDLVIAAEHLGIQWQQDSTALTRHAATQTSAAFWPMRASPLFSSAMPVPRRADGCSFDERHGAEGTLFHLECPHMQELVRVQLWNPFQGPSLFDVLRADSADVLLSKLLAAGHDPLRRVLYVAFDTQSTVVDLVSVPPSSGRWWIVRDGISRELLRPVTTWVEEAMMQGQVVPARAQAHWGAQQEAPRQTRRLAAAVAATQRGVRGDGVFDWTVPRQYGDAAHIIHYLSGLCPPFVFWLLHYRGRGSVICATAGQMDWQYLAQEAHEAFLSPSFLQGAFGIQHNSRVFAYGSELVAPPHGTILHLVRTGARPSSSSQSTVWDSPAELPWIPQFEYNLCLGPRHEGPIQEGRPGTLATPPASEELHASLAYMQHLLGGLEQSVGKCQVVATALESCQAPQGSAHANGATTGDEAQYIAINPTCVLAEESDEEAPDGPTEPSSPDLTDLQAPTPISNIEHGIDARVGIVQRPSDSSLARTSAPLRGDYEPLIGAFDQCLIPQLQRTVSACLSEVDMEQPATPMIPAGCPFTIHNPFTSRSQCKVMSEAIPSPQVIPTGASHCMAVMAVFVNRIALLLTVGYMTGWDVRRIDPPPGLPANLAVHSELSCLLRDGDVLDVSLAESETSPYLIRNPAELKNNVLWTCRVVLQAPAFVRIWSPRLRPPILVCIPAGECWEPADSTFSGDFRISHPGRWVPARWTPCSLPHLVQASEETDSANVLFEDSSGVLCVTFDKQVTPFDIMHGTADSCRGVRVLGNFHVGAHAPLELRDGDVVVTGPLTHADEAAWPDLRSAVSPSLIGRALVWMSCLSTASRFGCIISLLLTPALGASTSGSTHLQSRSRSPHREATARCPSPRIGYWRPECRHQMSMVATRSECHFQVLCPFRGWGTPVPYTRTLESQQLMEAVHRDSGSWAVGALPLGGSHMEHFTVILPLPPAPLVTVLLHTAGTSRAVLLPSCSTLRHISDYLVSCANVPGMSVLVPPALKRVGGYEDEMVRLRHGDTFELEAGPWHPFCRHHEAAEIPDLHHLPHLNVWHMPFVIRSGGWVSVWSTHRDGTSCHSRHWIPDGALWSPRWLQLSTDGRPLADGRWVPAAYLPDHHVSFVEQPEPQAVHVLLSQPYDSAATACRRLLLDSSAERTALNRISEEWQLRPDLHARVVVNWPRNGDVMVPRVLWRAFQYSFLSANVARLTRRPVWGFLGLLSLLSFAEGVTVSPLQASIASGVVEQPPADGALHAVALAMIGAKWRSRLLLTLPVVGAMVVPPAEQQQTPPVPIGKHPWRVPQHLRLCGESVEHCSRARLLSPFCGEGDEVEISPDTPVEDLHVSLSSEEPYWYGELMPVWPAIWPHTAVYMPIPWQLAVLTPRRTDLEWLLAHLRRITPGPVISVHPPAAARSKDDLERGAIDWRSGDVVLAFQCGGTAAAYELPVFFSPAHVRYTALWSHDFVVQCDLTLLIWRVGRPPAETVMPPPARWVSSEQTFTGVDSNELPPLRDGDTVFHGDEEEPNPAYRQYPWVIVTLTVCRFSWRACSLALAGVWSLSLDFPDSGPVRSYGRPSDSFSATDSDLRTVKVFRSAVTLPAGRARGMLSCCLAQLSCYLAALGVPVWVRQGDVWQCDLTSVCDLQARLHSLWWSRPLRDSLPVTFPRSYHAAWGSLPSWSGGVPESLLISTDGSGIHGGSWAFVVRAYFGSTWYRVGWDAMALAATPWLPASGHLPYNQTSYISELIALQAAAIWCTAAIDKWQMCMHASPANVTVVVDNSAALQVAAGHAAATQATASTTRVLWQAVQSRVNTTFRHVHSHVGVMVNTLVDGLAGLRLPCPLVLQEADHACAFLATLPGPQLFGQVEYRQLVVLEIGTHEGTVRVRSVDKASEFWNELKLAVLRAPSYRGLLFGVDANADFFASDDDEHLIGHLLAAGEPGRNDMRLHAVMQSQERKLASKIHALARRDKAAHFLSLTQAATDLWHSEGRPMEALTKLRWASRKAAEKRAVFAAGGYDIDAQLEEQFRAQEGGRCVTPQQIATEFAGWVDSHAPPCPAALPTLLELEHLCRRQQAAKAPGPDLILNELWRAFPAYAGQWFWQVCTQIALTGHEPFHFKMALICALYKKGPAALPQNYRSTALLNGMAKVWHSHLRTTVGQSVLKGYSPFQLGGRRGIPVGFAVSAYRCAAELSHAAGRSLAVLFIDIQAAYYEASRRLVFQGDDLAAPDEGLCREHLAPLALELLRSGALEAIGMPVEERHLLQDCVECSHWRLVTSDHIYMLPLEDHGQGTALPMLFLEPYSLWPCGIFAASVLLKALLTTRSGRLLALMERSYSWDFPRLASIAISTLQAIKFRVNLGTGKTEAILDIRGPHAKRVRGELLGGSSSLALTGNLALRLAPEYRYLGVVQTPHDTGRRDTELCARRACSAWAHGRSLLSSSFIPWVLKTSWMSGRILPAAYATLATWSARAWSPLTGFYERAARTLIGSWQFGHFLTGPLLGAVLGLLTPGHAAVIARVRLVVQLVTVAPPELFDLFDAAWNRATPWRETLADSLHTISVAMSLSDSRRSVASIAFVRQHAQALKKTCRRLSRKAYGIVLPTLPAASA
ncbi:RNA-directed DNA polymerase from mobile element jockey [Symbiodinium microadriaticum]|uniref:RNA-directed DNA polymerase from mobile element jockey n=1 Tax=Symbiodinium microadriaticum TaxID=2951 RepID=A0A1Q9D6T3_SYMMI|nr:RNA-directed DNA polymerase from mobile element jockey [Symbiodinium microadriaticum]CAE7884579.1 pol [Symbiodinium sp. KB8]